VPVNDLNPYRQPNPPVDQPLQQRPPASCPQCGGGSTSKVTFSWWGGLLGPKLFHVVKCLRCGTQYNGKTGGRLNTVITVYLLVAFAAFGGIFAGLGYYLVTLH
jgi:hypothetical protein